MKPRFTIRCEHAGIGFSLFVHSSRNAVEGADCLLVVARDITERKRAEQDLIGTQVQLQQALKLESIGRLAAGIAHEINTPTQFVGDNLRFLQENLGDLAGLLTEYTRVLEAARQGALVTDQIAQAQAALERANAEYLVNEIPKATEQSLEGVSRVAKIVRAMKDFSHPGSAEKTSVSLNQAIESTVTVCRNEWKYGADVELDLRPSLPPVPCLPGEFNQLVLNLVINAAHAIGEAVRHGGTGKGNITVSSRRDGDWVEIWIRDTGNGIPENIRDRIARRFVRSPGRPLWPRGLHRSRRSGPVPDEIPRPP